MVLRMSETYTKEQWINKCAERLIDVTKMDYKLAKSIAESQLENCNGDLSEDPVDAAESEMSYWND